MNGWKWVEWKKQQRRHQQQQRIIWSPYEQEKGEEERYSNAKHWMCTVIIPRGLKNPKIDNTRANGVYVCVQVNNGTSEKDETEK